MPIAKVRVREFDPRGNIGLQYFQEVAISGGSRPSIPKDIIEKWNSSLMRLLKLFNADIGRVTQITSQQITVLTYQSTLDNYVIQEKVKPLGLASYSETVIGTNGSLYIEDSAKLPLWKENYDQHQGLHGFLGFPLEWPGHETFGTIEILTKNKLSASELHQEMMIELTQSMIGDLRQLHLEQQLEFFSTMDPLTQTSNRRILQEWVQTEFHRTQRNKSPFAIGIFHIANLKDLNREYGRPVGDSTLEEIAQILIDGIRNTDEVGRWSDTHFMVLCPDTGKAGVEALKQKLEEAFDQHSYTEKIDVTVETEWIIANGEEDNLNELLNKFHF